MIAYIVTICNGDFTRIKQRKSSMTWFEQWFYYFEFKYGHTNIRQIDMEKAWEMHHFALNQIKDCKLALDAAGLESWPPYASLKEDEDLRNKEKWKHFDGQRVVMWDMTNVSAYRFQHPVSQRATWSDYYGENCFKGGVGCQTCGATRNNSLWVGVVTDSGCNQGAGYLAD